MLKENWTRDQTIIVLRTYFSIPFNKANNSNPEIISIAKLIGRTINSVKMKIGNFGSLDPELAKRGIVGLSGASNLDKNVWKEFAHDRETLAYESANLMSKMSNKSLETILDVPDSDVPEGMEKLKMIKTRINQAFFRESIMGIYDSKCCITGLCHPKLLVASHIVPWSIDKRNRLNPENGLCLNSIHDKAFDSGLLTITTKYKVQLSKSITDLKADAATKIFLLNFNGKAINMPERYFPNQDFLDYHNKNIFIK